MQAAKTYLRNVWGCRYFWLSLVGIDLRTRYRGSALGIGWSLLNPICMTIIFCVVFSAIWKANVVDFAPYVMAGLTLWQFISTAILQGCDCFFAGESYIRQHPAPMAIYPLRTVLGAAFHFLMGFMLVIAISLIFHGPTYIGLSALLSLLPAFALLLIFGWSLAALFAVATVRFRDLRHLSEVGLQALFYLTPIIYGAEQVEELMSRRTVGWIFILNPFVPFLDMLRSPVCDGRAATPATFLAASVITLVSLVAAVVVLRAEEREIIFHM